METAPTTSTPPPTASRPRVHFSPERNWMNDPNGLVFHRGVWHLYFQHNPSGTEHATIGWGHATSTDLVHWQEHDVAIPADDDGDVFSGSIVVDHGNTSGFGSADAPPLVAIYTRAAPHGQAQALASSTDDGHTWTKYDGNPVLDRGTTDFRDPKVFRYDGPAGSYWVMVAAEAHDRQILLHRSDDLRTWEYLSSFGPSGPVGGVWECPDLFPLPLDGDDTDQRWVLLISTNPGGVAGGSGTHYVVGDFDGRAFRPLEDRTPVSADADGAWPEQDRAALAAFDWLDHGRDCYAGVTFSGTAPPDRVLIAWMSNWDYARHVPTDGWLGTMTLARRLSLVTVDGRPVLRQELVGPQLTVDAQHRDVDVRPGAAVRLGAAPLAGRLTLEVTLQPGATGFGVGVRQSADGRGGALLRYDAADRSLALARTDTAVPVHRTFSSTEHATLRTVGTTIRLELWLDATSLEVAADDGLVTITDLVFSDPQDTELVVTAIGGPVRLDVTIATPVH